MPGIMGFHALDSLEFFAAFVAFEEHIPIVDVIIILVKDNANSTVVSFHVDLVEFARC